MTTEGFAFPTLEVARHPYPRMAKARAESPVSQVPGRNDFLVTKQKDVRYILSHPELFSSQTIERQPDGTTDIATVEYARTPVVRPIVQCDPPEHTIKRKLAFEHFKPGKVKTHEAMITRVVDDLIAAFGDKDRVEFINDFATPLPARVILNILGLPEEDAYLAQLWAPFEGFAIPYHTPERRVEIAGTITGMADYVIGAITERYENPRDDVLSTLIANHVEARGALNLPEVVADTTTILLGGIITTAHLLGWALWMLLSNPDQAALAMHDETRTVRAIEEALRLESPVAWTPRLALEDTRVGDHDIPAGATVFCHIGSANRDEERFEDPDAFNLDRANVKDHLAFGLHTHFCLGAPLARMEARIAFQRLFEQFPNMRLAPENDFEPHDSMVFRGLNQLHLELG